MVFVLRHVNNGEILLLGLDETYTLGRSRRNSIHLRDVTVCNKHATIKTAKDRIVLEDDNSINGTWLNKDRIQGSYELQSGDVILFGTADCKYVFLDPKFEALIDERIESASKCALELTLRNLNVKTATNFTSTCTHYITKLVTIASLMEGPILYFLIDRRNVVTLKYFIDILDNIKEAPLIPNIYRYMPDIDDCLKSKGIVDIDPRRNRSYIFDNVIFIFFNVNVHDKVCPLIVKCGGDSTIFLKGNQFFNNLFQNWNRFIYIAVPELDQKGYEQMKKFSETMHLKEKRFMTMEPHDIYTRILKGDSINSIEDSEVVFVPNVSQEVILLDASDDEDLLPELDKTIISSEGNNSTKQKSPNTLAKSSKNEPITADYCLREKSRSTLNRWITSPKKRKRPGNMPPKDASKTTAETKMPTVEKRKGTQNSLLNGSSNEIHVQLTVNTGLSGSLKNCPADSRSLDNSQGSFVFNLSPSFEIRDRNQLKPSSLFKEHRRRHQDDSDCSTDPDILREKRTSD